jgi:hypothetical protein
MNKLLLSALKYAELGFSVIPVGKDKKPYVKWEPYQKQKADKAQIEKWWERTPEAGVAIITGAISGVCVVDIDTPQGEEAFNEKIGEVHCPVAHSPRGGKHLYFQDMGCGNKTGFLPGVDFRGEGGYIIAPPSPGPNGKVYSWDKGAKITDIPPAAAPLYLKELINSLCMPRNMLVATTEQQKVTKGNIDFGEGHRDESIFHVANCLTKGGMPDSEIEQIAILMATKVCEPPFPESEARVKIRSALSRMERKERVISQEIRDFIGNNNGTVRLQLIYNGLQLVTKEDKKNAMVVMGRLLKEGILERTGALAGEYRIVDKKFEEIDLNEIEDSDSIDVRLPFGMDQYVEIMPKDLIVFAGAPNAGKTALMFETVRLNMERWKCWYFSTELGRHNAKKRLAKSEECKKWTFKFVDEIPNYYDIIKPDAMNFIDYVEVSEGEYFKIPSILAGIQKRLRGGVAFVALQKLPKLQHAVGGGMTLAKPALFCAVDADYPGATITMVKAKNYKDINPNGYKMRFKIHNGINLTQESSWQPEY